MRPNVGLDPEYAAVLKRAGAGDYAAQRALTELASAKVAEATITGEDYDLCVMEAFFCARLAASNGGDRDHANLALATASVARFLGATGRRELADFACAETLAIAEVLAERGDEASALAANDMARFFSPDVIQQAKELREEALRDDGQ